MLIPFYFPICACFQIGRHQKCFSIFPFIEKLCIVNTWRQENKCNFNINNNEVEGKLVRDFRNSRGKILKDYMTKFVIRNYKYIKINECNRFTNAKRKMLVKREMRKIQVSKQLNEQKEKTTF